MAASRRHGPDPQISSRRAARLYRLLTTLERGSKTRSQLIKLGRAGMRTFYRDLTFLEENKINIKMAGGKYELSTPIGHALARLPFNQRAVIVLRFYVGLGEADIARELGCRPGSVGPWTRRGLDRLAAELLPQGQERS